MLPAPFIHFTPFSLLPSIFWRSLLCTNFHCSFLIPLAPSAVKIGKKERASENGREQGERGKMYKGSREHISPLTEPHFCCRSPVQFWDFWKPPAVISKNMEKICSGILECPRKHYTGRITLGGFNLVNLIKPILVLVFRYSDWYSSYSMTFTRANSKLPPILSFLAACLRPELDKNLDR